MNFLVTAFASLSKVVYIFSFTFMFNVNCVNLTSMGY